MVINVSDAGYSKKQRLKKKLGVFFIIVIVVFPLIFLIKFFSGEDSWIKDEKGIWIKHGFPASTPDYVTEQHQAISCASEFYASESMNGTSFSSQCLGTCGNYVVDIVHVPRTSEDNLQENQCFDYISGKAKHFIELNSQGQIVRIK